MCRSLRQITETRKKALVPVVYTFMGRELDFSGEKTPVVPPRLPSFNSPAVPSSHHRDEKLKG